MNKRGMELSLITLFYVFIVLLIFVTLGSRIQAAGDDTAYRLEFYARDIAYTISAFCAADGEGTYTYPLAEEYMAAIDIVTSTVHVRKDSATTSYVYTGSDTCSISLAPLLGASPFKNPYVITKRIILPLEGVT